jgi:N-acetylglucosamine malate deacetylase 1
LPNVRAAFYGGIMTATSPQCALAIVAHPDDIEYEMAGTLLLLKQAGWQIHYFNLCTGSCGSLQMDPEETARVRLEEAQRAASLLGASFHPPIVPDMEVVYGVPLLRKVAAVIRAAAPQIVLTHSLEDYMEDHMETARLAVSAAFTHAMPNFVTDPPLTPHSLEADITVYHALPHGSINGMRQEIVAEFYVDTTTVHALKLAALAEHQSQQHWLEASQGMNSYLQAMEDMSLEVGQQSGKFLHAEGWRKHAHRGFSRTDVDPLSTALSTFVQPNPAYADSLRAPRS